jgi:hypothetical protein
MKANPFSETRRNISETISPLSEKLVRRASENAKKWQKASLLAKSSWLQAVMKRYICLAGLIRVE